MRNDKEKALKLRLQGKSYSEINCELGIPKSTLSGWFSDLELPEKARQRLKKRAREGSQKGLLKRNKKQTHLARQRAKATRQKARKQIDELTKQELLVVGAALYWAEGYKRPIIKKGKKRTYHPVSLANSDPHLVSVFLKFLREVCGV